MKPSWIIRIWEGHWPHKHHQRNQLIREANSSQNWYLSHELHNEKQSIFVAYFSFTSSYCCTTSVYSTPIFLLFGDPKTSAGDAEFPSLLAKNTRTKRFSTANHGCWSTPTVGTYLLVTLEPICRQCWNQSWCCAIVPSSSWRGLSQAVGPKW